MTYESHTFKSTTHNGHLIEAMTQILKAATQNCHILKQWLKKSNSLSNDLWKFKFLKRQLKVVILLKQRLTIITQNCNDSKNQE